MYCLAGGIKDVGAWGEEDWGAEAVCGAAWELAGEGCDGCARRWPKFVTSVLR